jgi:hypothetical protein
MSNKQPNGNVRQPYMDTAWFAGLMDEVRRSNKTVVARKMGFSRSSISQVCNGCGPYGNGDASTERIESAYRRQYEQLACPHTGMQVGIAHCRDTALRRAPTHNPLQMQQWQACQRCAYRPEKEVDTPDLPRSVKRQAAPVEPQQQAGVIDKVTLPLPEVGAPQVGMEAA